MEIRKTTPDEYLQAVKVSAGAFMTQLPPDYREAYKDPFSPHSVNKNTWAAYNDSGKMVSLMQVIDFDIRFDGHTVKMNGIGGVSTLPEARAGGYVRRINETLLPLMKEQGVVFSFLYPFSFAFYRKFGYELGYSPNRLRIPMHYFKDYPFPSNMTMYEPGDDISPFREIYNAFTRDKNLAIVRDEAWMKFRIDNDPYTTRIYTFLHRDAQHKPDAYIKYKTEVNYNGDKEMYVKELAWITPQGLHAIFGFVAGLASQYEFFHWDAPYAFNAFPLFSESYEMSITSHSYGMNRIINAQKAFELMKAPGQPGKAVIQVTDKFMPGNDGIYELEWESERMTSVKKGSKEADLETDIETLVQLVTGYMTPRDVRLKRGIKINGNEAALRALFPFKDAVIMDYF